MARVSVRKPVFRTFFVVFGVNQFTEPVVFAVK